MPSTVTLPDLALRLVLTVVAGAILGINRSEHGRAAGLRTTLLVCLAGSLAIILTNLFLSTTGRPADSFAQIDPMRLPLGVLTGVGFIGAGTILRRGRSVQGVTTAATLWLSTVLGFCFGAGEHLVGGVGLGLGLGALWGLEKVEDRLVRERRAILTIVADAAGPTDDEVRSQLAGSGFRLASWQVRVVPGDEQKRHKLRCEVIWHGRVVEFNTPELVRRLAQHPGVHKVDWKM